MRYVDARIKAKGKTEAYRVYVTEALRRIVGFPVGYADLTKEKPEETRSAEEIIEGISKKLSAMGNEK